MWAGRLVLGYYREVLSVGLCSGFCPRRFSRRSCSCCLSRSTVRFSSYCPQNQSQSSHAKSTIPQPQWSPTHRRPSNCSSYLFYQQNILLTSAKFTSAPFLHLKKNHYLTSFSNNRLIFLDLFLISSRKRRFMSAGTS